MYMSTGIFPVLWRHLLILTMEENCWGPWAEHFFYNMKQKTIEVSDNVTLIKGINKFTFGTHNEFYDLTYGFINSWNGRWEYSRGVNSFLADNPSRIRGAFTTDLKIANDRNVIYNDPPDPFN